MSESINLAPVTVAADADAIAVAAAVPSPQVRKLSPRLRAVALAMVVPLGLLLFWYVMVKWTGTRLVPLPSGVAVMMWDFAFGGIYDDAYSASLPIHFWKSVQRVYGGFFCGGGGGVLLGVWFAPIPLRRACFSL